MLKDRIPLYEAIGSLREYMNIIDRTYLTLADKERLTKKERENYRIIGYRFTSGSLTVDMAIELVGMVQETFPFLMPAGAVGLWETAKSSYKYARTVLGLWSENKTPEIQQNINCRELVQIKDCNIEVHPTVVLNAERIEDNVRAITGYVKKGSIDQISLRDKNEQGIVITEEEKRLFVPDTEIDDEPETITVNIYRLDKEKRKGKLHVIEGMEPKDLLFEIVGDQPVEAYIDALKQDRVKVKTLKEMATNLSGKEYVARLQLIGLPGTTSEEAKLF